MFKIQKLSLLSFPLLICAQLNADTSNLATCGQAASVKEVAGNLLYAPVVAAAYAGKKLGYAYDKAAAFSKKAVDVAGKTVAPYVENVMIPALVKVDKARKQATSWFNALPISHKLTYGALAITAVLAVVAVKTVKWAPGVYKNSYDKYWLVTEDGEWLSIPSAPAQPEVGKTGTEDNELSDKCPVCHEHCEAYKDFLNKK